MVVEAEGLLGGPLADRCSGSVTERPSAPLLGRNSAWFSGLGGALAASVQRVGIADLAALAHQVEHGACLRAATSRATIKETSWAPRLVNTAREPAGLERRPLLGRRRDGLRRGLPAPRAGAPPGPGSERRGRALPAGAAAFGGRAALRARREPAASPAVSAERGTSTR